MNKIGTTFWRVHIKTKKYKHTD